jgi:predicted neuraminidase
VLGAWFGGTEEGLPDSGIYLARLQAGAAAWDRPNLIAPPDGHPCGNPVLFAGGSGVLWLTYFRVWGMWCTGGRPCARISLDGGETWGPEVRLLEREGVLTKNKPLLLGDELLLPVYDEIRWQVGFARLDRARQDQTRPAAAWRFDDLAIGAGSGVSMIQGTVVEIAAGRLLMLMRTMAGRIWEVESDDAGASWHGLRATPLRNPNAGIDMVRLRDGRLWLCYNDTDRGRDPVVFDLRYPLCLAESTDAGASWHNILTLEREPGEYSYPAVILDQDGQVHIAYTRLRREIRHVVLEP